MKCRICKSVLKSKKTSNCRDYEYKYPGTFYFDICRDCSTCMLNPFQSDSKLSSITQMITIVIIRRVILYLKHFTELHIY